MALKRIGLALLLVSLFSTLAAAEGRRVILVLDASGSMWGQIAGKAKIDIAKLVIGNVIGTWKPEDEIGLVAYGHRQKGSCEDIETLIEPGAFNAETFMSSVKALTPKGKTPMTQAVRQAAEALKFTEKSATVILVSDGIETCDPNPCAVAEELEKLGIGLTVHTVGFGLDDKGAVEQLKCLAEKTGGIAVIADDAKQLETALNQTVQAQPEAPAPAAEPELPAFNFKGRVVMAEAVDDLPNGFNTPSWEVFKSIGGEKGDWVQTEYGSSVKMQIANDGEYLVVVSADNAKIQTPIKVEGGKAPELDLSFEAGLVTFQAYADDATPMTDGSTTWEFLDKNGNWLTTKYGPEAQFFANASNYKIRLSLGAAKLEQDVTFMPGKVETKKLVLGGGLIEVSGFFTQGGDPLLDGAAIELREGNAGVDGTHKWIETLYGPVVQFKVAPGKYQIVAQQDYASGISEIEVGAGKAVKLPVILNAGFLAATAQSDATMEVYSGAKDLSGNRKWIATEYNGQFNKALNGGSYVVVAKLSDGTVVGEKEVNIEPGKRLEVALP